MSANLNPGGRRNAGPFACRSLLFGFGGGFSYAGQVIRTPRTPEPVLPAEALPHF